jgi:hypothetical protein
METTTLMEAPPTVATRPFEFWGCTEIRESLGIRADSERLLMERLETVPGESIYYHTVRSLLRRGIVPTSYPGDFAIWVATEVRDPILAERLALSSPFDFSDIEAFREHLLGVMDDHLSRMPFAPRGMGSPFYFLRGHMASIPLEIAAPSLASFRTALAQVDVSSVYYHGVEAIGRRSDARGDFAAWVEDSLRLPALAEKMRQVDPFVLSLEDMRSRLLALIDQELARGQGGER